MEKSLEGSLISLVGNKKGKQCDDHYEETCSKFRNFQFPV